MLQGAGSYLQSSLGSLSLNIQKVDNRRWGERSAVGEGDQEMEGGEGRRKERTEMALFTQQLLTMSDLHHGQALMKNQN